MTVLTQNIFMFKYTSETDSFKKLSLNDYKTYSRFFSDNLLKITEKFNVQNVLKRFSYGKALYLWNFISTKNQKKQFNSDLLKKVYQNEIKVNNYLKKKSSKIENFTFSKLECKILEKIPIYLFLNKTEKNERILNILEKDKSFETSKTNQKIFNKFKHFEKCLVQWQFKLIKNFTNFFDSDIGKNFKVLAGFTKFSKKDLSILKGNNFYFVQTHSLEPDIKLLKSFSNLSKGNFFFLKKGKDYLYDIYLESVFQNIYKPKQLNSFQQETEQFGTNYSIYKIPNIYKQYNLKENPSILPIFLDKKDILETSSFSSKFNKFFESQEGSPSFSFSIYETNLYFLFRDIIKTPTFFNYDFLIFPSNSNCQLEFSNSKAIFKHIKIYLLDFSDYLESFNDNVNILHFYPFKDLRGNAKLFLAFSTSEKQAKFLWNDFSLKIPNLSKVPKIKETNLSELFLSIRNLDLTSKNLFIFSDFYSLDKKINRLYIKK